MQIENKQSNEFVIDTFNQLIQLYKTSQTEPVEIKKNNEPDNSQKADIKTSNEESVISMKKEEQPSQGEQQNISPELMWEIQYIKWFHSFHKNIVNSAK